MSEVVADSCVAAKWVVAESDSSKAQALLAEAARRGERMTILELAFAEVGNVLWKHQRSGMITAGEAKSLWEKFNGLPLTIVPIHHVLDRALEIAIAYDRSVYDAAFVAAVEKRRARGVTSDAKLHRAVAGDFPAIELL
ncbi:MAG TPA: type II toxin-antitoxin system VapC family toxin [Phycisphaerae bacterium]|jgi:predicted nucleic acid-binding protein|nr:type II toxin-antitoxin system VapC family toxin [Phycisphaerae bacterium]